MVNAEEAKRLAREAFQTQEERDAIRIEEAMGILDTRITNEIQSGNFYTEVTPAILRLDNTTQFDTIVRQLRDSGYEVTLNQATQFSLLKVGISWEN